MLLLYTNTNPIMSYPHHSSMHHHIIYRCIISPTPPVYRRQAQSLHDMLYYTVTYVIKEYIIYTHQPICYTMSHWDFLGDMILVTWCGWQKDVSLLIPGVNYERRDGQKIDNIHNVQHIFLNEVMSGHFGITCGHMSHEVNWGQPLVVWKRKFVKQFR